MLTLGSDDCVYCGKKDTPCRQVPAPVPFSDCWCDDCRGRAEAEWMKFWYEAVGSRIKTGPVHTPTQAERDRQALDTDKFSLPAEERTIEIRGREYEQAGWLQGQEAVIMERMRRAKPYVIQEADLIPEEVNLQRHSE